MRSIHEFRIVAITVMTALIAGCSSSGRISEGNKAIEGFSDVRESVAKAQTQVDKTLQSMSQLSAGGDVSKSYKAFSANVDDLKDIADSARQRSESMRKNVEAYVAKWQKEMETVQDPTIKASLSQRRDAVRSNFDSVRASAQACREAYQPFMKHLEEIDKALSIDLSPAAVPGLKPAMDKAQIEGQTLKQRLSSMQGELDRIESGMSSTGAARKT